MSYNVLKEVNLNLYAHDMHRLFFELQDFLTEKFKGQSIEFQNNERIVFYQTDLDFYITKDFPGFSLYNLQLILKELNIPNYFCILVSNLPNIKQYAERACQILTSDMCPIATITSLFNCVCVFPVEQINNNFLDVTYPFIVLSRQSRFHRTYFISQLFYKKLESAGLVGYNNIKAKNENYASTTDRKLSNCIFLSTDPFIINNHELVIQKNKNQQIVSKFQKEITSYKNFVENNNPHDKMLVTNYQKNIINQAFIYLGLETTVTHPQVFLSTISFKGIVNKRPFIILGVPGTLKYLQSLGFKTFSRFWSEDYDNIINFEDRVDAILKILDAWKNMSPAQLQETLIVMQEILDYNYSHFSNQFYNDQKNLIKEISS